MTSSPVDLLHLRGRAHIVTIRSGREWRFTVQEDVRQQSDRPNGSSSVGVLLPIEPLRRVVVLSSLEHSVGTGRYPGSTPKVDEFYLLSPGVVQQVLQLYVPVVDPLPFKVADRGQELGDDAGCSELVKVLVFPVHVLVEVFIPGTVLHDNDPGVVVFEVVDVSDNVGMSQVPP